MLFKFVMILFMHGNSKNKIKKTDIILNKVKNSGAYFFKREEIIEIIKIITIKFIFIIQRPFL